METIKYISEPELDLNHSLIKHLTELMETEPNLEMKQVSILSEATEEPRIRIQTVGGKTLTFSVAELKPGAIILRVADLQADGTSHNHTISTSYPDTHKAVRILLSEALLTLFPATDK